MKPKEYKYVVSIKKPHSAHCSESMRSKRIKVAMVRAKIARRVRKANAGSRKKS